MLDLLGCSLVVAERDVLCVVLEEARQRANFFGDRCGKEMRLSTFRQVGCDLAHVRPETEGKHFVGFVEDQDLELVEVHAAVTDMVEDPTRGAHDDVCAGFEAVDLRAVADPAINREATNASVLANGCHFLRNLDRKFAGGKHDQGLGRLGVNVDRLTDRNAEGARLATARERLDDKITA